MFAVFSAMTPFILINIHQCFGKTYDLAFRLEAEFAVSRSMFSSLFSSLFSAV
jgi:hypothetical protein